MNILIVDDNEDNLYQLQALFSGNGYRVVKASQGVMALEKARENPPDLVISDVLMPVMDGFALCRAWMQDKRLKQIPFVFYTATYTDDRDREFALSLGARRFIVKPEEPEVFLRVIGEVFEQLKNPPPAAAQPPTVSAGQEGAVYLVQYNEVLIRKLEQKMGQLEKLNHDLERDIAERKRVEEAHTRLATAVEQTGEGIVITDAAGVIQYVNPAFEKITGYSREEAAGLTPRILKSGKYDDAFYRQMWETVARGETWSGRIVNRKKGGTFYEEEMTISPVRDLAGKIVNYVAVKHDVTQEVRLESQLRQAQKMEAVGQLAGGVAHDLNNILTVINGNASLMLNLELDPAEQADCADQVLRASERAAALTRQLLMFSRKQVMQPVNLDLNETVEGMIKMLKRVLGEDIALRSELAPDLPPVCADSGMIEQVLLNLAVNARDAMPGGGSLTIATGRQLPEGKPAQPNPSGPAGESVWLKVSDTGCGIAPEVRPHIFEPFFTTKPVGKGTGLGLATVFGIVQQHHGWINVVSEAGKGATFQVHLPAAKGSPAGQKSVVALRLPTGTETVLVVEDDSSLRLLISRVLERCGHKVYRAASGVVALQVWKEHREKIVLLLTDLVMPDGLSGFELARKLQAEKPELKVIYTSGYVAKAGEGPPLIEGVNFLQKPYSSHVLAQAVRNCLDRK